MIGYQFLRLPFYGGPIESKIAEAFAFCYAAQYADTSVSNRMAESYKRAWDFDDWTFTPSQFLGRPGYVRVTFGGDYRPKTLLAIKGFGSWPALVNLRGGIGPQTVATWPGHNTNLDGKVYGAFADYAATIVSELDVHLGSISVSQMRNTPFVITGFSMGAAIAEIIATMMKRRWGINNVRLIKFASPKVGTAAWVNQRTMSQDKWSVYTHLDPIVYAPLSTPRLAGLTSNSLVPAYVNDSMAEFHDLQGTPAGGRRLSPVEAFRAIATIPPGMPARDNAWWWHHWNTYRYALCSLLQAGGFPTADRLIHLEHTDENAWGSRFSLRANDWASLITLTSPPPADRDPAVTIEATRIAETIRMREAAMTVDTDADSTGGGWLDSDFIGGSGGGDVGSPPPDPSPVSPVVRVQRTTRTRRPVVPVP